jgi:hypothetical protein
MALHSDKSCKHIDYFMHYIWFPNNNQEDRTKGNRQRKDLYVTYHLLPLKFSFSIKQFLTFLFFAVKFLTTKSNIYFVPIITLKG